MSARGAERVADEAAEYLTADDVARILTVSRTTAYKLMRQMGRLVEGRVVRVSRTSLDLWIARHSEPPVRKRRGGDDRQIAIPFRRP